MDIKICILVTENGKEEEVAQHLSIKNLISLVGNNNIETIVFAETKDNKVLFEKHFCAADVMPAGFGKRDR